jgi:hypothetical protein
MRRGNDHLRRPARADWHNARQSIDNDDQSPTFAEQRFNYGEVGDDDSKF